MSPRKPPVGPDQLAELYGITFTDNERMLLTSGGPFGVHERQHRYVLVQALAPIKCPACGGFTCRRAACTVPWDTAQSIPDDAYACQICETRLIWRLALIGPSQWFDLAPGQTITTGRPGGGDPHA